MAIPSYLNNVLDKNTNTFGDWFAKTNQLSQDMGSKVLTAETTSSGGSTTGNTSLDGIFSANIIAVGTELRGGTVQTPGSLTISSNTSFTGQSTVFNTNQHSISSNTIVISANTFTSTSESVSFTANNTINIDAPTIDINGTLSINSSDYIKIPAGINSERPNTPQAGMFRFNNTNSVFEGYNGTEWGELGGSTEINDETTNASRYLTFVGSTTGEAETLYVTSSKLYFNPSTGQLNATEFNSLSDVTYKENVKGIDETTNVIDLLNPVQFDWKDSGKHSYGLIAQELENVMPELVTDNDGVKSVSYIPLISLLINEVKQLRSIIKNK